MIGARPRLSSSIISSLGLRMNAWPEREHLLLAAGEVAGLLVEPLAQHREEPEHLLGDLGDVLGLVLVEPRGELQVLGDGEGGEHALAAGHEHHALGHGLGGALPGDLVAVEDDAAPARPGEARDGGEQRGLAGAVGAEQGDDLVPVDVAVHAEEHLRLAVGELEVADGEQRPRAVGVRLDGVAARSELGPLLQRVAGPPERGGEAGGQRHGLGRRRRGRRPRRRAGRRAGSARRRRAAARSAAGRCRARRRPAAQPARQHHEDEEHADARHEQLRQRRRGERRVLEEGEVGGADQRAGHRAQPADDGDGEHQDPGLGVEVRHAQAVQVVHVQRAGDAGDEARPARTR